MLLTRIWKNDKKYGVAFAVVLTLYALVHITKLEVYPLYMFAMFSQDFDQKEDYTSYSIEADGVPVNWSSFDYRKFTYINNTIRQYNDILINGIHPETKVIDKFVRRVQLKNTAFHNQLLRPYKVNPVEMKTAMNTFLSGEFQASQVTVFKNTYEWKRNELVRKNKVIIHE